MIFTIIVGHWSSFVFCYNDYLQLNAILPPRLVLARDPFLTNETVLVEESSVVAKATAAVEVSPRLIPMSDYVEMGDYPGAGVSPKTDLFAVDKIYLCILTFTCSLLCAR